MSVTLFEMRVFEDIIKGLKMRSPECSRQTLNPVTSVFTRDRKGKDTDREERPCEDGD